MSLCPLMPWWGIMLSTIITSHNIYWQCLFMVKARAMSLCPRMPWCGVIPSTVITSRSIYSCAVNVACCQSLWDCILYLSIFIYSAADLCVCCTLLRGCGAYSVLRRILYKHLSCAMLNCVVYAFTWWDILAATSKSDHLHSEYYYIDDPNIGHLYSLQNKEPQLIF